MTYRFKPYIIFLVILVTGLFYHYKYLNEFPSHIHAWAQSDRYALSLGFIENGLNFFKPQTFVLNHQFPDNWKNPSDITITAVNFPIHEFIVAIIMRVTGNNSPLIFRLYIFIYSLFGLYFLFKLSYLFTKNYLRSLIILLFASTAPLFVYYQGSFLPTIPSLSNAIIGLYFYFSFIKQNKIGYFHKAIFFLTLASLSRMTFAIPLISLAGNEFIRFLRKDSLLKPKILPLLISFVTILLFEAYSSHLRNTYGSIFLNNFLPVESLQAAFEILRMVYENWGYHYFTIWHYLFIATTIIVLVHFIFKKSVRLKHHISLNILFYILIHFTGCFMFAGLMLRQFPLHDYYFLDTFFLPVLITLILIFSEIPFIKKSVFKITSGVFICVMIFFMFFRSNHVQQKRHKTGDWDQIRSTIENFQNSDNLLDSLHIAKDARILVLDAMAPNIPFILMKRKGYFLMPPSKENLKTALQWNYDFIIYQNENFITKIYNNYPEIIRHLQIYGFNDKITICKYSAEINTRTILNYLTIDEDSPLFEIRSDFDSIPLPKLKNIDTTSLHAFSGNYSGYIDSSKTYAFSLNVKQVPKINKGFRIIQFSAQFMQNDPTHFETVCILKNKDKIVYRKSYNVGKRITNQNKWYPVQQYFYLPQIKNGNHEMNFYFWNTGKNSIFIDDIDLKIF